MQVSLVAARPPLAALLPTRAKQPGPALGCASRQRRCTRSARARTSASADGEAAERGSPPQQQPEFKEEDVSLEATRQRGTRRPCRSCLTRGLSAAPPPARSGRTSSGRCPLLRTTSPSARSPRSRSALRECWQGAGQARRVQASAGGVNERCPLQSMQSLPDMCPATPHCRQPTPHTAQRCRLLHVVR